MQMLSKIKDTSAKILEDIKDSDAFQKVRTKYEELDSQTKLYIHLGLLSAGALLVLSTIFTGLTKVNTIKSEINDLEAVISSLRQSADEIQRLKAQQSQSRNTNAIGNSLTSFVEGLAAISGFDPKKVEIGTEQPGVDDKTTTETLLDVKILQVNLKQLNQFLFELTDRGSSKNLNIKTLNIDTKGDPSGYLDAMITLAIYNPK